MNLEALAEKKTLRRRMRQLLDSMPASFRAESSEQARERLTKQAIWQSARSVLFFAPMEEEVDIWPLLSRALNEKKNVALPRYRPEADSYLVCALTDAEGDIQSGAFGIREPAAHCRSLEWMQLDLILVPGLAFDTRGRRLGRGKGYYDRLLAEARGVTCGVAFDEQVVSEVPVSPHDITVHCILTPSRWIAV